MIDPSQLDGQEHIWPDHFPALKTGGWRTRLLGPCRALLQPSSHCRPPPQLVQWPGVSSNRWQHHSIPNTCQTLHGPVNKVLGPGKQGILDAEPAPPAGCSSCSSLCPHLSSDLTGYLYCPPSSPDTSTPSLRPFLLLRNPFFLLNNSFWSI